MLADKSAAAVLLLIRFTGQHLYLKMPGYLSPFKLASLVQLRCPLKFKFETKAVSDSTTIILNQRYWYVSKWCTKVTVLVLKLRQQFSCFLVWYIWQINQPSKTIVLIRFSCKALGDSSHSHWKRLPIVLLQLGFVSTFSQTKAREADWGLKRNCSWSGLV